MDACDREAQRIQEAIDGRDLAAGDDGNRAAEQRIEMHERLARGKIELDRVGVLNLLAAELHVSPQLTTYYYGFNLDRPLFQDARIRRALSLVIDRERLANSVLRVGELPAYGWVPPGILDYSSRLPELPIF